MSASMNGFGKKGFGRLLQSKELLQELQGRNPHETAGLLAAFAGGWTPSGSCRSRIFALAGR
jgi:hypothetical protein